MFGSKRAEPVEEFLARGGKIKKLDVGDCQRKRVDKMKRIYARLIKNDELEQAEVIRLKIEEYTKKEFNPWYAEKK